MRRFALNRIQQSPEAAELLGVPIHAGFSVSSSRSAGNVFNLNFKAIGPKNTVCLVLSMCDVDC
jgi:hypothetical protein